MFAIYSAKTIRDALQEGTRTGFRLFSEIHDSAVKERLGCDPDSARLVAEMLRAAEQIGDRQPEQITYQIFTEYSRSGERETYDRLLTQRLNELALLGMAAHLDGSDKWIGAVQERMWELCNLYIWELTAVVSLEPSSYGKKRPDPRENLGLLAAETAFQLMEMIHTLGVRLDPFLVYRVRKEVAERVFRPYLNYPFWWQTATTNWQSVCSSSIGCAALYLIEDEEELSLLLGRIIQGLQCYLEGFDQEGVTTEGLDYWTYGFASFVFFAELLRERTADRLRLLEHPQVKAIAAFPHVIMLSEGSVVNFSDCGEQASLPGYLAVRLEQQLDLSYGMVPKQNVRMPAESIARWSYLSRSLLWTAVAGAAEEQKQASGMTFLRESQWLVDKRTIEHGKLLAFAAKGGHNDEPHNHNDIGHFILHVAGKNVMPDLGAPEYNYSTFSQERYKHLLTSSRGHSVPSINGKDQTPGRERFASVIDCLDDGTIVRYKLELSKAYDAPELESYTREWEWDYMSRTLLVRDSFVFIQEVNEVEQTFLFRDKPSLLQSGALQVDAGVCLLEVHYPETAAVHISADTYRVRTGEETRAYRVRMTNRYSRNTASFELFIRIAVPK
ncbi:MAG: Heparinase family protein [Paenibacillus sp.]|nr:Heparinase family protein [Paenibacillus sp.]